jgi:hypothetical protein
MAQEGWYLLIWDKVINKYRMARGNFLTAYYKDGEWFEHSRCEEDDRITGYVSKNYTVLSKVENLQNKLTLLEEI